MKWKCCMRGPELPALLRSWPQQVGEGSRPYCGTRPLPLPAAGEKGRTRSGKEFKAEAERGLYLTSTERAWTLLQSAGLHRENYNRKTNENVETYKRSRCECLRALGENSCTSVWGQILSGPITSWRRKKAQGCKLDRWWLLFVDCVPVFIFSVSSAFYYGQI